MTAIASASTTVIVHAADGVRFVATADCADALSVSLAAYVRARYNDVLWADAARRVRGLLDDGKLAEAIALYFERTGERWDRERLDVVTEGIEAYGIADRERMADAGR